MGRLSTTECTYLPTYLEHMPKYTPTFSLLLIFLTFRFNLVTLGNAFTDFLLSCRNTVPTQAPIIQWKSVDSIYVGINLHAWRFWLFLSGGPHNSGISTQYSC